MKLSQADRVRDRLIILRVQQQMIGERFEFDTIAHIELVLKLHPIIPSALI